MNIQEALARVIAREMNGNGGDRGGDILERAVGKKKLGSGNAGKLSTSNTTTQTNPLFPNFGPGPIMGPNGQINPAFSAYDTLQSNSQSAIPFQIQDLPPDVYTVQFSTQGQPPYNGAATGVVLSTEADVTFSVDGRQSRRKVSVNQGTRICGQADSITVSIRDNSNLAQAGRAYATVQYTVSLAISRGVRPDQAQPPTLAPVDANGIVLQPAVMQLAPGVSLAIPVPQDVGVIATQATVWDITGPGGAITEGEVSVQYFNNGTLLCAFDPRCTPWVPIRPGTNMVQLANNWTDTVQFSLLFGIDG